MCKLIMSINPEHVANILSGSKRFEFRKIKCKREIDAIVIYVTAPVMKVVAEVEVKDVIDDSPQVVWRQTSYAAGIDKAFFDSYYNGRNRAIAYALGNVTRYSKPFELSDIGIKTAPQSFAYLN